MLKKIIQKSLNLCGYQLHKIKTHEDYTFPVECDDKDKEIVQYVLKNKLTMVSPERLIATIQACKYVVNNNIAGDFVECGVWRGGNAIAAKMIFEHLGSNKQVYMFDTFAGMTKPEDKDFGLFDNVSSHDMYNKHQQDGHNEWCYASLEDVKENAKKANIEISGVHFIKGDVLETLETPKNIPEKIGVLRLDTDWYDSTKKELDVLYPKLSKQGVLLIDDYGYWAGSHKAVEEYFDVLNPRPLLHITDITGRMAIKL